MLWSLLASATMAAWQISTSSTYGCRYACWSATGNYPGNSLALPVTEPIAAPYTDEIIWLTWRHWLWHHHDHHCRTWVTVVWHWQHLCQAKTWHSDMPVPRAVSPPVWQWCLLAFAQKRSTGRLKGTSIVVGPPWGSLKICSNVFKLVNYELWKINY